MEKYWFQRPMTLVATRLLGEETTAIVATDRRTRMFVEVHLLTLHTEPHMDTLREEGSTTGSTVADLWAMDEETWATGEEGEGAMVATPAMRTMGGTSTVESSIASGAAVDLFYAVDRRRLQYSHTAVNA